MAIDELQHLAIRGHDGGRQVQESGQHGFEAAEIAQGEFADDKWVRQNEIRVEQRSKCGFTDAKMGDPDGRVSQNHAEAGRRLGGALRRGSAPPSRASRRALSRSMSALSASRTRL